VDFTKKVRAAAKKNNSSLCVGLDIDLEKIPPFLLKKQDPFFEFAKTIIDYTHEYVCAYKPNMAFFEAEGVDGLNSLKKIIDYVPDNIPVILDAKRGDIGNTAKAYAKSVFDDFKADAVTLSPYMGLDSIQPFLDYADKGVFVLGLTSNVGSNDFQRLELNGEALYLHVAKKIAQWDNGNIGIVVGATHPSDFEAIRKILPTQPFLIPGIGAQGGDLKAALTLGSNDKNQLAIINSSRGIIYASKNDDFGLAAQLAAKQFCTEASTILQSL
jgi:orotidine-5'-phosphate decarboxylase